MAVGPLLRASAVPTPGKAYLKLTLTVAVLRTMQFVLYHPQKNGGRRPNRTCSNTCACQDPYSGRWSRGEVKRAGHR